MSDRYSYRRFVDEVERVAISPRTSSASAPPIARPYVAAIDRLSWVELALRMGLAPRVRARLAAVAKSLLPNFVVDALRRRLASE
jgi:hypothetical protein